MYKVIPGNSFPEGLPTMYDLPSEDPEEPGLPDEFHPTQSQLLHDTFQSTVVPSDQCFIGRDINLYYDANHTQWYKRPDWFVVLGVPSSATVTQMRWSYVIWQERVSPFLAIELLSPGTEDEDLGQTLRLVGKPPTKWDVYEQILQIPYYVLFDRYLNQLRVFQLNSIASQYQELELQNSRFWLEEIQLGLAVWEGRYQGAYGQWLRWYDSNNDWIPTPVEQAEQQRQRADQEQRQAEQERQRAEKAQQRAEALANQLRALGINPEMVE